MVDQQGASRQIIVAQSYDSSAAVVALPAVGGGRLQDERLKSWLSRSGLLRTPGPRELLATILDALNEPEPLGGLAALRMWGQTGTRPTSWVAAAEPVYLEPRLDHLCLHAQGAKALPRSDLKRLFDHLQRVFAGDSGIDFVRIGSCAYLRSSEPIATASVPAYVVDQNKPDDFMPMGADAASFRNLISEVEMALHDHAVNIERQSQGLAPVNSLWFWGGGVASPPQARQHPPLFSDDPLLQGYWHNSTAVAESWPGSIANCLQASAAGFVAVVPESDQDADLLQVCLGELREALAAGRLNRLILMFRDGIKVDIVKQHSLRFWRRSSKLLDAASL